MELVTKLGLNMLRLGVCGDYCRRRYIEGDKLKVGSCVACDVSVVYLQWR